MKRKRFGYFEDVTLSDNFDEAAWPELQATLRVDSPFQDLGLWHLAEESTRLTGRRATLLEPSLRSSARSPRWPDAA